MEGRTPMDKNLLIEELRQKVSNLENILAILPGHVYWLNRDNVYLGCNDILVQTLKLSSRRNIVGKRNIDILENKAQAAGLDATNRKVMETGETFSLEETTTYQASTKTFLTQKVPLKDSTGEINGLLGVSFDITDFKQMEQSKATRKKAEVSKQVKSDFIRNMEHDIRTPLSGILSVATYLADQEKDLQKKGLLEDLESASQELIAYFNSVVAVSRMNGFGIPLLKERFNLKDLVISIYKLELPAAKNKNLALHIDFKEDVPHDLVGDSFRVYRILLNLTSNAVKFTQKGYVKITISIAKKKSNQALIEFKVKDTGIGISADDHEKIYEKFSSSSSDEKNRANTGFGVGLWIVKQFVNDLKGSIEIKSKLGKGSIFTCQLELELP